MIPWEREVYLTFLQQYIEEENLKAQQSGLNEGRLSSPILGMQVRRNVIPANAIMEASSTTGTRS